VWPIAFCRKWSIWPLHGSFGTKFNIIADMPLVKEKLMPDKKPRDNRQKLPRSGMIAGFLDGHKKALGISEGSLTHCCLSSPVEAPRSITLTRDGTPAVYG
jgi:hypothetical protein